MTDRRTAIKSAALAGFLENGYAATTITQIGRKSGSTVGSIYHAFSGKAAIAYEIWMDGQPEDFATVMANASNKPRKAIAALIEHYLNWGWSNPDLYRFHRDLMMRSKSDPDFAPLTVEIETQMRECAAIFQTWVNDGGIQDVDWSVASALIFGPADHYLESSAGKNDDLAATLANAAWQGLKPSKNDNAQTDKKNKKDKGGKKSK
ncbi:hypothetical protein BVC71_10005 [Marivivens niveibacter]|uniref:HTH tetR-type domain-containing protein n=1 Tax=Marivivens niveibacter TaxID=1930667 RepID=A0A251WX83_9RHOB|nr:TetR/AcrR family transcriptional regulator [Marivivens niveibacter]OUD09037.1 hypothetical protein BVC71_10005 [Marivivens niveibacter]